MSRFGDKCNVTACNHNHDSIKHKYNNHLYCLFCARKINEYNPGEPLFNKEDINSGRDIRNERDRNV